jgi:hypothetical protein
MTPHSESPTIVSKFPYDHANLAKVQSEFHDATILPPASFGTIVWIATCPRVFGLHNDSRLTVRLCCQTTSLMDGGGNICITGDLLLMVGIVDIPPMAILVAIEGTEVTKDDCCTKREYIPLSCSDGSIYWQLCFYCANIVKTIISPQAVLASSNVFYLWTQTGFKDSRPVTIRFDSADGLLTMHIALDYLGGLCYCQNDVYIMDLTPHPKTISDQPVAPTVFRVASLTPPTSLRRPSRYTLVSKSKQLESELWLLHLGSPGVFQLDVLPGNTTGLPMEFDYDSFWFIDFKAQAQICKQAAQRSAVRTPDRTRQFYIDFGFMRASAADYSQASKSRSRGLLLRRVHVIPANC